MGNPKGNPGKNMDEIRRGEIMMKRLGLKYRINII